MYLIRPMLEIVDCCSVVHFNLHVWVDPTGRGGEVKGGEVEEGEEERGEEQGGEVERGEME